MLCFLFNYRRFKMTNKIKKPKKKNRFTFFKGIKVLFILIFMAIILAGGAIGSAVVAIVDEAPAIDPTTIQSSLSQTSSIYDPNGILIEKILAEELRTLVSIKQMPQHLIDAFIAIEDERFEEHPG